MTALCLGYMALPPAAQSQIGSKQISAPDFSSASHVAQAMTPRAPVQVELPPPPPMRILPGLEEPLVATGPVSDEENKDLDAALAAFHNAPLNAAPDSDYSDYAKPLLAFVAAHPRSNWNAALNLNLGLGYHHAGYYSRAFTCFEQSWRLGRDATNPQARLMVDRAVGELARMHARVGHADELEAVLKDMGKRPIGGPATELIQNAREGLWAFHHTPEVAYLCGPNALKNLLITLKSSPKQIKVAMDARSGPHGFSLTQLAALADKAKLKYRLIHREAGQPVPVPSVINWNVHHYAAITGEEGGVYILEDPTFADAGRKALSIKAIDAEGSGYFLVPSNVVAANPQAGWRTVAADSAEAQAVYGMGDPTSTMPGQYKGNDANMCHATASSTGVAPTHSGSQMCAVDAKTMPVSLNLTDTPVGYAPQKGPPAYTALFYNQREDMQPATFGFSNVSSKWAHSWQAYVQDDPAHPGTTVTRYASGGGGYTYNAGYSTTTGAFTADTDDNSQLFRVPATGTATSYYRQMPDGGRQVYALFDGATTFPRHVFLTGVVDPAGNTTTINYDATFRVTSVTDAMGRATTFTYGLAGFPLLITKVTDPFSRSSQLNYDTSQRLSSITDPIGITSSFTYSATEPTFITTLTTPYGASTFNDTPNPNDTVEVNTRSLTLTDPLGFTDFLYYYQNPSITPPNAPPGTIPAGMTTDDGLLEYRNTYVWSKHAFALGVTMTGGQVTAEDFSKAKILHWLHTPYFTNANGRVLGSIKNPLENRVYFNYPNQGGSNLSGSLDQPSAIGRVLDNATSQISTYTYNPLGNPVFVRPPEGGYTEYTYATNNIDVQSLIQYGTGAGTIASYGNYNTQHEPQTFTDLFGKVWHYTYNAAGQLATVTDPNSGLTTYNYDTSSRLSNIVNANLVTALTLTYDSADRIRTRTDSEGYVLTYDYDNLDRITKITYPDATTDLYDYTFQSGPLLGTPSLDLRKHTDRLGRVTTYGYDANRQRTSVTEPTSGSATRTTTFAYYEDGSLKDIIDANSNDTHYEIDIESRPVSKTYAYGTSSAKTETYAYENTTSRLKSVTDALSQTKTYSYTIDDRLAGIAYTGSVNPTPNVTFAYNVNAGGLVSRDLLSSMTDGLGTTTFAYTAPATNGALQLASITGPYTNNTVSATYDLLGRAITRNVTGGNESFGYDPLSRMNSHGTPLGSFTYGYLGQTDQTASRSVTNGAVTVSTNWGYDTNANDRRLKTITNSGVTRSYTLTYGSAPVNVYDIMGITDTAATGHPWATQSRAYTYDLIDRLLTASSTTPGNDTYAYDKLDNATTYNVPGTSTSPTYNGFNQIATWGAKTYAYDAAGNLTSGDGARTYKYDAENRLIEIDYVGTSNKSVFSYNGLGQRILDAETVSGTTTTTRYLWCPDAATLSRRVPGQVYTFGTVTPPIALSAHICQTRTSADVVQRRHFDEGELNVTTGQKLVYMPDQLGSVRDVLDATTGTRVASYDYTPYGAVARSSVTNGTDFQFAGLFAHPQSGLNLATYRAQDGVTGRWIKRDPIGENGGINLYGYVGANPIMMFDWLGLANCTCQAQGGGTRAIGTDEKICIYKCSCSCDGRSENFTTPYTAGTSDVAKCVGQVDPEWTQPGRPLYFTPFTFDTNSFFDRYVSPIGPPRGFLDRINDLLKPPRGTK